MTETDLHPDTGDHLTTGAEDVEAVVVVVVIVEVDTPTYQDVLSTGSKSEDYLPLAAGRYSGF